MNHEAKKHLLDALLACRAISEFTSGKKFEEYSNNLLLRSAVERQFEILGEAFGRLNNIAPEYREECSSIGKIIGMRNRIIHGYDSVDDNIAWDAICNHIPPLTEWLESLDPEPSDRT